MYGLCIINEFAACTGSRNLNFQTNLKKSQKILRNRKKSENFEQKKQLNELLKHSGGVNTRNYVSLPHPNWQKSHGLM